MQFSETEVGNTKTQMREAVSAAKLGHKNLARKLLTSVVEQDPNHEEAWLWCAALAENEEEAQRCLTKVLDINPNNQQALNALALARLRQAAKRRQTAPEGPPASVIPLEAKPAVTSGAKLEAPPEEIKEHATVAEPQGYCCPLCRCPFPKPKDRCHRCGALLHVDKIDDLAGNRDADEMAVQEAVQRLLKEIKSEPTAEAHIALATAYLNLNRSAEALPHLEKACALQPNESASAALQKLKTRRLVLTVDDSLTVRKIVAMTLERFGYRVLSAGDGMQALAKLNEQSPDLILLDITMPRMDGYQVCKTIKQNPYTRQIPVLMLSGKDGFFDKVKGRLAGATDYLTKPFQEEELIKAVEKHMKPRQ